MSVGSFGFAIGVAYFLAASVLIFQRSHSVTFFQR
jgi:hypothetical protein